MKSKKQIRPEIITQIPRPGCHEEWLVFECGSRYPVFSLKKPMQKTKGHNDGKRKCPKCFSKMVGKIFTCSVCGISFKRQPRTTSNTTRCFACQYRHGLNKRAALNRKRYAENKKGPVRKSTWSRRNRTADFLKKPRVDPKSDCRYYLSECLTKAAFKNSPFVDCYGCQRYEKVEQHAKTTSNGGTFTPTHFGCERGRL
jgi:hypothetical protein